MVSRNVFAIINSCGTDEANPYLYRPWFTVCFVVRKPIMIPAAYHWWYEQPVIPLATHKYKVSSLRHHYVSSKVFTTDSFVANRRSLAQYAISRRIWSQCSLSTIFDRSNPAAPPKSLEFHSSEALVDVGTDRTYNHSKRAAKPGRLDTTWAIQGKEEDFSISSVN